jgi:hypothetical protein
MAYNGPYTRIHALKRFWPPRIVVDDNDGSHVGLTPRVSFNAMLGRPSRGRECLLE